MNLVREYVRFVRFAFWSARVELCDRLPDRVDTCWIHGYSFDMDASGRLRDGGIPDRWWRLFGWR